jgi:predicted RNase H-like HicB family nuclease
MRLNASITREGDLYVAQCLEVDVASQGETAEQAVANLKEALELHFEDVPPTAAPRIVSVEVEVPTAAQQ